MENNTKWRGRFLTIAIGQAIFFDWKLSRPVCFDLVVGRTDRFADDYGGVAGLAAYLLWRFSAPLPGLPQINTAGKSSASRQIYPWIGSAGSGIFA